MKTYQEKENQNYTHTRTKLVRDTENKKIAGICAGLGKYFGIDVSLIRLAWFFLAFFGIFSAGISTFMVITFYFVLWLILPKSSTTYQFETKNL